jgi:hypothetical protein
LRVLDAALAERLTRTPSRLPSPGGTPDYRTRRTAAIHTEPPGAYAIFGYDHFRRRR